MGAIALVVRRQLARRWPGLIAAGIVLGLGFGVSYASIAAARRTESAYDRILAAADAPDAAVAHGRPLEEAERSLRSIPQITRLRTYAGFRAVADGIDPVLLTALLAPAQDQFPLELPVIHAGRLPAPDAPEEVFVNQVAADGAGLQVGQEIRLHFFEPDSDDTADTTVTIVGIGTFPTEAVSDETLVFGIFVFSHAFFDAHRNLVVYTATYVNLAPGFDARHDLATAVGALGDDLQATRSATAAAVNDAVQPLVVVLVALGLLAFAGTAITAGQIIQRDRAHGRSDREILRTIGMARSQVRAARLVVAGVIAGMAVLVSVLVMLLVSPIAPVGTLHDLDPAQGLSIDPVVALLGTVAIVLVIALLTVGLPAGRRAAAVHRRSTRLATAARGPAAFAGLTLALQREQGRGGPLWRRVVATTLAAGLLAWCSTFAASAVALSETPSRYGFDADLLALSAYGDQAEGSLVAAFGNTDKVAAATGFTLTTLSIDDRAVPALAASPIKGQVSPTILEGRTLRADNELVVGRDTLDALGAKVGDVVPVRLARDPSHRRSGEVAPAPIDLEIAGVATFPPVDQIGTDVPRLGIGALTTRTTFLRLGGDPRNQPEFTIVRVARGADPATVIARVPEGFRDTARTPTIWFTDAKPAEIRQLDAALPYLRGSILVGGILVFALLAFALWARARANRRDLSVLRTLGCIGRQLDAVTAWQALPFVAAAIAIGLPVGILVGRRSFIAFADSLAVVDHATTSLAMVGALVLTVLVATAIAELIAIVEARRTRTARALREADTRS